MMNFSSHSISQPGRFRGVGAQRAHSVAGGAGNVRMSSANVSMSSMGAPVFRGGSTQMDSGSFGNNSKETMNNLNDRLASYLERVHSLEQTNRDLEAKIHAFYEKKAAISAFDPSAYYKTIHNLRSQIQEATTDNARLLLHIDNAQLAADDFKIKFESELAIRLGVDGDINGLRKALDELTIQKSDLELDIERMKEELISMRKSHEEDAALHRQKVGGKVNVELDSAPPVDLSKMMTEIRQQYEGLMEKNRLEAENWYKTQSENLNKEVTMYQQSAHSFRSEVTDLRRTSQTLELELQSLINMRNALEGTLAETNGRYGAELVNIQKMIAQIEMDLQKVRTDSEQHSLEYRILLDAKTKLEMEIATYRRLLEAEDLSVAPQLETHRGVTIVSKEQSSSSTIQKVRTMVEEVVDGKVVTSSVQEVTRKLEAKN